MEYDQDDNDISKDAGTKPDKRRYLFILILK
jgi:hypothetical protein